MFIDEAKEIIDSLANGVNPITGKKLPNDSPYNNNKVISALTTACKYIEYTKDYAMWLGEKHRDNIDNDRPENSGLPWTETLTKELTEKHNDGKTIDQLSEYFERSNDSIQQKLVNLGLMRYMKNVSKQ